MRSGRTCCSTQARCAPLSEYSVTRRAEDPARQVLSNLANFKSFGYTKIVPRLPADKFAAVVAASANAANATPLWEELKAHIYQLSPEPANFIGKPALGHVSNYYLGEPVTDEEVAAIQEAAEKLDISVLNTR